MTDMDNDRTPTCLLCNNYFDQKPHLSQGEEADRDGEYFADFKKAFQLFCKLIKVVRNEGRGYVLEKEGLLHGGEEEELNGFAPELDHLRKGHHPCCGDCNMALLNLLRCEMIIKEAEVRKEKVLESLKMAIVENHDMHKCQLDEVWLPVRAKLVQSLEANKMNANSDEADIQIAQATNDGDYSEHIDDSYLQGPQHGSFDFNYVLPDLQDPELVMVDSSPLLPDPLEEEPPVKRRSGRTRKQVLHSRVIHNEDFKASSIKTKPCSISLTRIRVEDCPSDLKIDLKIPRKWHEEEKDAALADSEPASRNVKILLGQVNKNCGLRRRKSKFERRGRKRKPSTSSSDQSANESVLNVDSDYKPGSSTKSAESGISDGEFETQPKLLKSKPALLKETESTTRRKPRRRNNRLDLRRNGGGGHKRARSKRGQGPGVHFRSVFYMITEDVLLFQNTLMKFDPSKLTCLEAGCSYFVTRAFGADYFTFEDMKAHIKNYHAKMDVRGCSLCGENFADGQSIRKHILSHTPHRIYIRCTIICQSCLKPMPFNRYLYHTWLHKNEEERAAAIASGETISSNVKRQLGLLEKQSTIMQSRFIDGNFFFNFGNNYLVHKGILIEFNPTEFICREGTCNTKIQGSNYDTFMQFQKHVETSHASLNMNIRRLCPLCPDSKFTDMCSFKQHIFQSHSPVGVCTSCWRPIKSYTAMGKHVWLHLSEEEMAAADAEGRCTGSYFPVRRKTEDMGIFSCQSCPKQFTRLSYLRTHEKIHVPKHLRPKYNCDECDFQVLNRKSLQDHIEQKHKPELVTRKNLKCRICGQEFHFRRGAELRTHMRSHSGETPFVCEICGKGFISSKTLKVHSNSVHVTDRPFQCQYCDKSYKLSYVLNLHQKRAHKGLLPQTDPEEKLKYVPLQYRQGVIGPVQMFPCEHCDKVLAFRSRLKYHMKISHPEVFESSWLT